MALTNNQLIRAYRNGKTNVKNGTGSLYVEDKMINGSPVPVLFSYGGHFPLAVLLQGIVFINGAYYSATTAQHQALIRRELIELQSVEIDTDAMKDIINNYDFNPAIELLLDRSKALYESAGRRRVEWRKKHDLKRSADAYSHASIIIHKFGFELDPTLHARFNNIEAA